MELVLIDCPCESFAHFLAFGAAEISILEFMNFLHLGFLINSFKVFKNSLVATNGLFGWAQHRYVLDLNNWFLLPFPK